MELERHLPSELIFYASGRAVSTKTPRVQAAALAETSACLIGFDVTGDEEGLLLLSFNREPSDVSMIMELANILASKAVSHVCDATGSDVKLSPPRYVDHEERKFRTHCEALANLAASSKGSVAAYEFFYAQETPILIIIGYFAMQGGKA